MKIILTTFFATLVSFQLSSQSYTTTFPTADGNYTVLETVFWVADLETNPWPGVDERHPSLSAGFSKKVQTSDWWSSLTYKPSDWDSPDNDFQATKMYSHPLSQKTEPEGLGLDYNSSPIEFDADFRSANSYHYNEIIVGMENLNSTNPKTYDYNDWMVTAELSDASRTILATYGHGNPFVYFTKSGVGDARIEVVATTWNEVSNSNEVIVININDHKWAFFAPDGASWSKSGVVYTSDLAGKDYWTVCLLPNVTSETTTTYPTTDLETFRKHAYAFPTNAEANYSYNQSNQEVNTTFSVTTTLKESVNGNVNSIIQGLYPHQWAYTNTSLTNYTYESPRGEIKVCEGNSFTTTHKYTGVLATLPNLGRFNEGYSKLELNALVESKRTATCPVSETYNQGKHFTQFIQLAQIADQIGNIEARDYFVSQVQTVLENWLTADVGETSRILWYNDEWDVLVGYPDGHYMASLLNDKHFHWGYFIDAACLVEQFNPGWANTWGDMVNLLIRDGNSWDRNDDLFPYCRNFDAYAGHNWASGSGAGGNNQESSSESMNFSQAVIKWGELTNNSTIRDHGIYLYTTEKYAIDEYWQDVNDRTMPDEFLTQYASRIFSSGLDTRTFWTGPDWDDPWIINMLPITGGSLYLGTDTSYVKKHINDYFTLDSLSAPTSWNDILWSYMALVDPEKALAQFNANPDYSVEFAESKAHTYHWIHNLCVLGHVNTTVYATNSSTAVCFEKNGIKTYVAFNPGSENKIVNFSDGYNLTVEAKETATSRDSEGLDLEETGDNIAANKTAYSSTDLGGNSAANVTDTDGTTRWESIHGIDPSWIYVDLEDTASLQYVLISWQNANAKDYVIQGSNDTNSWATLATLEGMRVGARTDFIKVSGNYQFVRVYGSQRGTDYGYSIFEIEVFEAGGTPENILVNSIELNQVSLDIAEGKSEQLIATINPDNASDQSVKWNSSDPSIAEVNSIGLVKTLKTGDAKISATTVIGNFTDTCYVKVFFDDFAPVNLALNKTVFASSEPEAANPGANTVDDNLNSRWSAETFPQSIIVDLGANYSIGSTELVFYNDRAYQYTIEVAEAFTGPYTKIVDQTTNTTAGTNTEPILDEFERVDTRYVKLTITGASGYAGTWIGVEEFRVFNAIVKNTIDVTGITVSPKTYTLILDNTKQIEAEILPLDASDQTHSWISLQPLIAEVGTDNGIVHAISVGTASIVATTTNGSFTDTCIITVEEPPIINESSISVSPSNFTLTKGDSKQLSATVLPLDATNKTVKWTSSLPLIAEVGVNTGLVNAIHKGTATITATTVNNHLTSTCIITVEENNQENGSTSTLVNLTNSIKVYPNPVSNQLKIDFGANSYNSIQLIDLRGKEIYSRKISQTSNKTLSISMTEIDMGLYILVVTGDSKTERIRIIKH